ncbi:hypothetical protein ACMV5L_22145 [Serratia plymuthica]|uniref:hypothetical protein n=1 Tax=Serratia plymuthica TaxID=82996 RepID=UPI003DA2B3C3
MLLTVLEGIEGNFLVNMEPACRQILKFLNHEVARAEKVSNEVFSIFDDYFDITRTSDRPLDVYISSGIHCALLFSEEIKVSETALRIDEQERLLQGIHEALLIGVDYLSASEQHVRERI